MFPLEKNSVIWIADDLNDETIMKLDQDAQRSFIASWDTQSKFDFENAEGKSAVVWNKLDDMVAFMNGFPQDWKVVTTSFENYLFSEEKTVEELESILQLYFDSLVFLISEEKLIEVYELMTDPPSPFHNVVCKTLRFNHLFLAVQFLCYSSKKGLLLELTVTC